MREQLTKSDAVVPDRPERQTVAGFQVFREGFELQGVGHPPAWIHGPVDRKGLIVWGEPQHLAVGKRERRDEEPNEVADFRLGRLRELHSPGAALTVALAK